MSRFVPPERRSSAHAAARLRTWALLLIGAAASGACDGSTRAPDAQARASAESAEVSVRFDVSAGKETTVHVIAFRATVSAPGGVRADVLGTVDPLATAAPLQGCAVRDVDAATRALGTQGAAIELEEMTGIGVGLGDGEALLRPFPRLFPDVATVIGGVVAEVGPQPVAALPDRVSLYTAETELPLADIAVPSAPRIVAVDGVAPVAAMRVDAQEALAVTVAGAAGGLLELRPYGATVAVACAIPASALPETIVTVPRALLGFVVGASGRGAGSSVAASLEVARRTRLRQALTSPTRVSVEVRAATLVELRP
jgi:hypothetical protein